MFARPSTPGAPRLNARRRALLGWAAACLLAAGPALPATLLPGAPLPALQLDDQHGKPVAIEAGTEWLIFTAERGSNDMVSQLLAAQPPGVLQRLKAVYVADISAMPGVVTTLFALPRMRGLPFAVALARDAAQAAQLADLPRQPGAATLLRFVDGRLSEVHHATQEAQLRALLKLQP